MRIGIVIPHIFMHRDILPHVIFSPGTLALDLAEGLRELGAEVTLFTPGPVDTPATNINADMTYFEQELAGRGDSYLDLLKKHPFTFITLARQVQAELIAKAYAMANAGDLDIVHVYANEEESALPFAALCTRPVVLTHHDPYNFLVKYKTVFPKYRHLNWLSVSMAQRDGMPEDTNWVGNIYHGLGAGTYRPADKPAGDYAAYLGRIISSKGTHLAIDAVRTHNAANPEDRLQLRIAGKHYSGKKDVYWQEQVGPRIDGEEITYEGFIGGKAAKQEFLANARFLIVPSRFDEPFGMVAIEALACGTPVIALDSGALPEVIRHGHTGYVVQKDDDEATTVARLARAIPDISRIDRTVCRQEFESSFTLERMCAEHLTVYGQLTG